MWKVKEKGRDAGWIGIFNRNEYSAEYSLSNDSLGFKKSYECSLFDIWNERA